MTNPQINDPKGKLYWVVSDFATELTADAVRLGAGALSGGCAGNVEQQDTNKHNVRVDCKMESGKTYRFWFVMDTDGNAGHLYNVLPGGYPLLIPATVTAPTTISYAVETPTSLGFILNYQILNFLNGGKVYWAVAKHGVPLGAKDVYTGSNTICHGHFSQQDNKLHNEDISCPLDTSSSYTIWLAFDDNGLGGNLNLANPGDSGVPITFPKSTHIEITVNSDATEKGFTWTYRIHNPSNGGKIYWSVIPSDGKVLTFDDILRGVDSNNCYGQEQQKDELEHTVSVTCTLVPEVVYRLYIALDDNGQGTNTYVVQPHGVPVEFNERTAQLVSFVIWVTDIQPDSFNFHYQSSDPFPGTLYWSVVPSDYHTTPDDVYQGTNSLCNGGFPEVSTSPGAKSILCTLQQNQQYKMCTAQDTDGKGTELVLSRCIDLELPRDPTQLSVEINGDVTFEGYSWQYSVTNPAPHGQIYWVTTNGNVEGVTAADVRDGNFDLGEGCSGIEDEFDELIHEVQVYCDMEPCGSTKKLWISTDDDGRGANEQLVTPLGITFTLPECATTTRRPTSSTLPPHPTPKPTPRPTKPNANCGVSYSVVTSDAWCEEEDEEHFVFLETNGLQDCANNVWLDETCSDTFYYSEELWRCACVKVNWVCNVEESDEDDYPGMSIYEIDGDGGWNPQRPSDASCYDAFTKDGASCEIIFEDEHCEFEEQELRYFLNIRTQQECCDAVRSNLYECTTTFHWGDHDHECACVRHGFYCKREESQHLDRSGYNVYRVIANGNDIPLPPPHQKFTRMVVDINDDATTAGFSWGYKMIDPVIGGKIYWVVTLGGSNGMSTTDVKEGRGAVGPKCKGEETQQSEADFTKKVDCGLNLGRYYKLWIAVQDQDNNAHSLSMVTPVGVTYFVKLDPSINVGVKWVVVQEAMTCEGEDSEHVLIRNVNGVQQCANKVFSNDKCTSTFYYSFQTWDCGCVKNTFLCAQEEADLDNAPGTNIYKIVNDNGYVAGADDGQGQRPMNYAYTIAVHQMFCEANDGEHLFFHGAKTPQDCADKTSAHVLKRCSTAFYFSKSQKVCACIKKNYECAEESSPDFNVYRLLPQCSIHICFCGKKIFSSSQEKSFFKGLHFHLLFKLIQNMCQGSDSIIFPRLV